MCLLARGANIFPLAALANLFRSVKIAPNMQWIMWFSGLRGAVAFALALNLKGSTPFSQLITTTTLFIVLFTVVVLGGTTKPFVRILTRAEIANRLAMSREDMTETVLNTPGGTAPDTGPTGQFESLDKRSSSFFNIRRGLLISLGFFCLFCAGE